MKIRKIGHCCLVIEEAGLRILTDPGEWTTDQNQEKDIDIILITHEHPDHLHVDSVKEVLRNNSKAQIVTNSAVGKILEKEQIQFVIVEHGQDLRISDLLIEGFGKMHAEIYDKLGMVANTGYFLANRFFYPGDALTNPKKPVEILALPVAGPWVKTMEVIEYAKNLKPKVCFPVHDGMLSRTMPYYWSPEAALKPAAIEFKVLELGMVAEL
ncbi:MAG: MBL fold metallo-hydrolase [Candidatus Sungbacteria bacterium]|nr:MBL fold metallo-hydrolase [Candidatus Sungbacteria bacterium]MBI4363581.1 MBL fold metallo-hydrolase [Candidatus Doudnabacteria bacterium]